ncbi:MAG: cytochrome c [Bacteroidota bacterium]
MEKYIFYFLPLPLICLLVAFQPEDAVMTMTDDTPVAEVLKELGAEPAAHLVDKSADNVSVEAGKRLVLEGIAAAPYGGKTRRQSKHFLCTSCHNVVKEDPDLRVADPEARLQYAVDNDLPFLPGTTLYGVVNRTTFYNGDYEKKYGDLVRPARKNLREAIALCATECAQGRELENWEMESVLSYLWTIGLKMGDLDMPESGMGKVQMALQGNGDKAAAAELVQSYFLDNSPATFLTPPPDRKEGYEGLVGDATRGQQIYDLSCLHCHGERRYSFFNLDDSKYSLDFLEKHFTVYTRYSTYQVVRYGTSPMGGKRAYMPHYTQQRMSNQQVEDLRAYVFRTEN